MTTSDIDQALDHFRADRFEQALQCLDRAVADQPHQAQIHYSRGFVLHLLHRPQEAIESFDRAIALDPNYRMALEYKAFPLLMLGDYAHGWRQHEERQRFASQERFAHLNAQRWTGAEPLAGKRILVYGEQGFGDQIQFVRLCPSLAQQGAQVILAVHPLLQPLLEDMPGIAQVIGDVQCLDLEGTGPVDYYCGLMSLPHLLSLTLENIPPPPYLSVRPNWQAMWRDRLTALGVPPADEGLAPFRIGVVWHGAHRPHQPEVWAINARRNLPFEYLAQLQGISQYGQRAQHEAVMFFSLQVGSAEIDSDQRSVAQHWHEPNWIDLTAELSDFEQTAALITQLDLIISVDTSVVHLAGALNKPVWVLNRHDSCWRWLLDRSGSPWYPSARLYRQPRFGDWQSVMDRVRADLQLALLHRRVLHHERLAHAAWGAEDFSQAAQHFCAVTQLRCHAGDFFNWGASLGRLGCSQEAIAAYEQALAIEPTHVDALYNRGIEHFQQAQAYAHAQSQGQEGHLGQSGHLQAAYDSLQALLAVAPEHAGAHEVLGLIKPTLAVQRNNEGIHKRSALDYVGARQAFEAAIALSDPLDKTHALAHFHLGLLLLLLGDYTRGWREYQWRCSLEPMAQAMTRFGCPLWLGDASLEGKTLLIWGEQGMGDVIQFCRYAPLLKARGASVILACDPSVHQALYGLAGVDALVAGDLKREPDFHCPLLSLPLAFGTTLQSIPHAPAYLQSQPDKHVQWQGFLEAHLGRRILGEPRRRIGLIWNGKTQRSLDAQTLFSFLPKHHQYVCLQKEIASRDEPAFAALAGSGLQVLRLDGQIQDLSDTAALCDLMDLVISVDTGVAHLSAALGKPTWVMLSTFIDWRWLLGREDSPWYPSVRLWRQDQTEGWASLLTRVQHALAT